MEQSHITLSNLLCNITDDHILQIKRELVKDRKPNVDLDNLFESIGVPPFNR